MNREEKLSIIESLKSDFANNKAVFLVSVQGLTVSQLQLLRKNIRGEQAYLQITKNTFARLAIHAMKGFQDLESRLKNQIGIIFVSEDPTGVARVICAYEKENSLFSIVAGCFESRILEKNMIHYLGTLPSKNVLFAQLLGVMKAPIQSCVYVLQQSIVQLLWVLQQASKK